MADNLEDIKLTKQDIENAAQYIKEMAILKGTKESELKLSKETIRTMAKEIATGQYKADKELIKDVKTALKDAIKEQKQAIQEQTKKNESFLSRIGFKEPGKDDLATQYRARQMAGGIESIMEGRFSSGARQILSTFPKVANFMGGPYFLAIQAVTSGLLKLDEAIFKAKQQVISSTGGVFSPFRQDALGASLYKIRIGEALKDYGLQGKSAEIMGAAYSSTGLGATLYTQGPLKGEVNKNLLEQRAINQGAVLKYMSSLGISEGSINNLLKISRNLEGQSEAQAMATQYRLADRFRKSRYMTEEEGMQQSLSLYEQTKSLGVNFEWASRTVAKFDRALQLGEVSLNDFAAITRSIKGSDAGRATGIASMIKDIAVRNGINLPEEFINSSDLGAGLYLQTREGISNKNIQQALKLLGTQIQGGMSIGSSEYDQARGLQMVLQQLYGSNISADMALKVQRSGNWTDILGGRSGVKPEDIIDQANNLKSEAKKLHEEERSVAQAVTEGVGTLINAYKAGILVNINEKQFGTFLQMMNPASSVFSAGKILKSGFNVLDNGTMEPAGN